MALTSLERRDCDLSESEATEWIDIAAKYGPSIVAWLRATIVSVIAGTAFVVGSWWDIRTKLESIERYGSSYARARTDSLGLELREVEDRLTRLEVKASGR